MRPSGKYYYENILSNQNETAKSNVAWAGDITELKLDRGKKAYIFLCVDIHTNIIISSVISKKPIDVQKIVRSLKNAIDKRHAFFCNKKLIIHTDRGTQFSSKAYNNFVKKYEELFIPSMSRINTPTDNPVAERFMRTFKTHKISNQTIEECLSIEMAANPKFNRYKYYFNKYVQSLNNKPNKKSLFKTPKQHDRDVTAASLLMSVPKYPKACSKHIGDDFRVEHVENFKNENKKVIGRLNELAAKRAEVVNSTPFDFEDNLALELIGKHISELHDLILSNPDITKQYVEEALEPIDDKLEEVRDNIDIIKKQLIKEKKRDRLVQPLRDPIDVNLFPLFFTNAGSQAVRQKDLRQCQLRIAYTLLYHTGLRINEIRSITKNDIFDAISASQLSIIHFKTKSPHIHILSKTAVQNLKKLTPEFRIVFDKYKFKYLFGKDKPIHKKTMIRMINQDLKNTCEANQIPFNIKSHSFRINLISNLLKCTTVQDTAEIIGHRNIQSTMSYKRYALSKEDIQNLLDQIETHKD